MSTSPLVQDIVQLSESPSDYVGHPNVNNFIMFNLLTKISDSIFLRGEMRMNILLRVNSLIITEVQRVY